MNNSEINSTRGRWLIAFAALLLLLSLLNCLRLLIHIDKNKYADFPIFYQAVQQYVDTGVLYTRNLEHYYPASGIYKFPALYSSFLLPLVKGGIPLEASQTILICLHIILYFISVVILIGMFMPQQNRIFFGLFSAVISLNLYSLYENLQSLQLEIYLLFFITLTLLLLNHQRHFFSGMTMAVAAVLKIYPAFLFFYFFWKRKINFFVGFFLALILLIFLMVACFGWDENRWYLFSALPVMLGEGAFINYQNVGIEKLINHFYATRQFIHYQTPLGVGSAAITKIILWACYLLGLFAFFRKGNIAGSNNNQAHYMGFSLLIALCLMTLKNPWSNYQVLLLIPLLYIFSLFFNATVGVFLKGIFLFVLLLLFVSPLHKYIFFDHIDRDAHPVFMMILSLLNGNVFDVRGAASLLVFVMLIVLLLRKENPSSRD